MEVTKYPVRLTSGCQVTNSPHFSLGSTGFPFVRIVFTILACMFPDDGMRCQREANVTEDTFLLPITPAPSATK